MLQTQTFLVGISLEQSITQAPIISNQKKPNHWTLCRFLNYETIQNKKWGCDTLKYLIKNQPPKKWGKQWVYTVVYTVSYIGCSSKRCFSRDGLLRAQGTPLGSRIFWLHWGDEGLKGWRFFSAQEKKTPDLKRQEEVDDVSGGTFSFLFLLFCCQGYMNINKIQWWYKYK